MIDPYVLEKWVWTAADFELMGWHDARVHAIAHIPEEWEFLLDLDYILKWNEPLPPAEHFSFWSAPATLVFQNVSALRIDVEPLSALEIADIRRSDPQPPRDGFHDPTAMHWLWTLEFFNGAIEFRSTGYRQYIRQAPVHNRMQYLALDQRGGFSFDRGHQSPAA
jgi:hypothetical protein